MPCRHYSAKRSSPSVLADRINKSIIRLVTLADCLPDGGSRTEEARGRRRVAPGIREVAGAD